MKRFSIISVLLLSVNFCFGQLEIPDNTNANVSEQDITSEDGYLGAKGHGKYSIWYGCDGNGQARGHVEKPFIWVEGINLTPGNEFESNIPVYRQSLYLPLMRDGFDIIQLDFNTNPQWIQRNAELLITLINVCL